MTQGIGLKRIDPESVESGLEMASSMIKDYCGGDFGTIVIESYPFKDRKSIEIEFHFWEDSWS